MKEGTFSWQWGRCGWGLSLDLFPELRLGVVRLSFSDSYIVDKLRAWQQQLDRAASALGLSKGTFRP